MRSTKGVRSQRAPYSSRSARPDSPATCACGASHLASVVQPYLPIRCRAGHND
jgi:hypothetical protein